MQVERLLAVASVATERWQRRDAEDRLREAGVLGEEDLSPFAVLKALNT